MKFDGESRLTRREVLNLLGASLALLTGCEPSLREPSSSPEPLRQMHCPPNQPATTTPRTAERAPTSTPTPPDASPSPMRSPVPNQGALGPAQIIKTYECFDTVDGKRVGPSPTIPPRFDATPTPSPTKSPVPRQF